MSYSRNRRKKTRHAHSAPWGRDDLTPNIRNRLEQGHLKLSEMPYPYPYRYRRPRLGYYLRGITLGLRE